METGGDEGTCGLEGLKSAGGAGAGVRWESSERICSKRRRLSDCATVLRGSGHSPQIRIFKDETPALYDLSPLVHCYCVTFLAVMRRSLPMCLRRSVQRSGANENTRNQRNEDDGQAVGWRHGFRTHDQARPNEGQAEVGGGTAGNKTHNSPDQRHTIPREKFYVSHSFPQAATALSR